MRGAATLRLLLLRHGQVDSNREYRYVGDRDESLTELGRRQAEQLAQALVAMPMSIERVVASPRRRTVETATALTERLDVPFSRDDRLAEQSYGDWEGLSRAEVRERGADAAARLELFERDPAVRPPAGESLVEVQRRVVDLVRELDRQSADSRVVALFSHVGPIKALRARFSTCR